MFCEFFMPSYDTQDTVYVAPTQWGYIPRNVWYNDQENVSLMLLSVKGLQFTPPSYSASRFRMSVCVNSKPFFGSLLTVSFSLNPLWLGILYSTDILTKIW